MSLTIAFLQSESQLASCLRAFDGLLRYFGHNVWSGFPDTVKADVQTSVAWTTPIYI